MAVETPDQLITMAKAGKLGPGTLSRDEISVHLIWAHHKYATPKRSRRLMRRMNDLVKLVKKHGKQHSAVRKAAEALRSDIGRSKMFRATWKVLKKWARSEKKGGVGVRWDVSRPPRGYGF